MARTQWYPVIGLVLATNLIAALMLPTWVNTLNPALTPLLWFIH